MVSACLCQATVRRTQLPCLRKTKAGSDFCGYHIKNSPPTETDEDCTICMCSIDNKKPRDVVTTPCKHVFHKACLDQWTSRGNNSCPLCRGSLGMMASPQQSQSQRRIGMIIEDFLEAYDRASTVRAGQFYLAESFHSDGTRRVVVLNTETGTAFIV